MSNSKSFKQLAAATKKRYASIRNIKFGEYCILKQEDALEHQLYNWEGLQAEIEKRRKIKNIEGLVKMPFRNMLRNEHIPYN